MHLVLGLGLTPIVMIDKSEHDYQNESAPRKKCIIVTFIQRPERLVHMFKTQSVMNKRQV